MNLLPASLALTLPAAASTASSAIKKVGQSFQQLMAGAGESSPSVDSSANSLTLGEKLSQLAESFRDWLSQHRINSPFELELSSASSISENSGVDSGGISIRGTQSTEIRQLLSENPEQLSQLTKLLGSIQAASPISSGSARIFVSDLDSSISY